MADITMPQLGETVTEGTITKWFKQVGEAVDVLPSSVGTLLARAQKRFVEAYGGGANGGS